MVYVGSVQPHRGLEELVEATLQMNNVHIFVLGRPNSEWGYKLLRRYNKQISLIGAVRPDEISEALKAFDVGISLIQYSCLSYYFSCPTKVWELIAAGIPQIASDFPEVRKLILGNEVGPVGRVVDPGDVNEIRRNIQEMLSAPQELEIYRTNCLKLRESCSWEVESKNLLCLYHSIV